MDNNAELAKVPIAADPAPSRSSDWVKYASIVSGLFIVAVTTLILYSISVAGQTAQGVTNALTPKVNYTTLLSGAIGELKNESKLVVLTANITATVTQENTTTLAGVPLGSAKVEISAPAVVQYYLRLQDVTPDDLVFDEANKRLVMTIPRPMLDTDMLNVASNPDKIIQKTEIGWSPLSVFKRESTRIEAMRHLSESALQQGKHELLQDRADKNAREHVQEHFQKVLKAANQDVKVDVEFKK